MLTTPFPVAPILVANPAASEPLNVQPLLALLHHEYHNAPLYLATVSSPGSSRGGSGWGRAQLATHRLPPTASSTIAA